jgi:hypothetical protein
MKGLTRSILKPLPQAALAPIGATEGGWSPAAWFSAGEKGAAYWITPDFYGLYQDNLGITPVTAVEQTVGMVLDRRIGAQVGSEQILDPDFNDTSKWTKTTPWSVSGGVATHNGTSADYIYTATEAPTVGEWYQVDVVVDSIAGGVISVYLGQTPASYNITVAGTYRFIAICPGTGLKYALRSNNAGGGNTVVSRFSAKPLPGNHATQATSGSRPKLTARNNLLLGTTALSTQTVPCLASQHTLSFQGTGTVTLSGASTAGPLVGTGANDRVSLTFTPTAGNVTFTVSGSVTNAQLEYGPAFTRYQRVTTATDYDAAGFPHRLLFDGVDDFLSTASTDFSATDKMTIVSGVTKFSNASAQIIAELSTSVLTYAGTFYLMTNDGGAGPWSSLSRGSATLVGGQAGYDNTSAVDATVISATHDIAGDLSVLRRGGVNGTNGTADKGTGNFGNHPMYFGRRAGTSLPFNGEWSSLIIRGAATADVTPAESFAANLHGVTL